VHVVGWSYGNGIALLLAVQHPELVKSLFVHEPGGIATFVTDAADVKAAGEDRRDMVTPAASASKAGDTAGAVRLFYDGVTGQPGSFETLSPAVRSMLLDNARTIPLLFAAPPPLRSAAPSWVRSRCPWPLPRGNWRGRPSGLWRTRPAGASRGRDSLLCYKDGTPLLRPALRRSMKYCSAF